MLHLTRQWSEPSDARPLRVNEDRRTTAPGDCAAQPILADSVSTRRCQEADRADECAAAHRHIRQLNRANLIARISSLVSGNRSAFVMLTPSGRYAGRLQQEKRQMRDHLVPFARVQVLEHRRLECDAQLTLGLWWSRCRHRQQLMRSGYMRHGAPRRCGEHPRSFVEVLAATAAGAGLRARPPTLAERPVPCLRIRRL